MSSSDASDGAETPVVLSAAKDPLFAEKKQVLQSPQDDILVICGPTAAGKSDIALGLALETGRSLLVADSRQVYRGFDIGTAKPTADERRRVRHHAIDVVEPTERFSAA